jgi:hypothetical protein
MSLLKADTVWKLSKYIGNWDFRFLENISPEKLMKGFLDTKIFCWFHIMNRVFTQRGYGITVTENTVVVYGCKEPVKLPFSDKEVGQKLQTYLFNWLDESLKR